MPIHDFYAKLTASNSSNENTLFAALRRLTLLEDPKSAFSADDHALDNWAAWVPAGPGTV